MTKFYFLILFSLFTVFSGDGMFAQKHDPIRNYPTETDYQCVFPQHKVNRIDITIDFVNWKQLVTLLQKKFGESGRRCFGRPDMPFDFLHVRGDMAPPPFPPDMPPPDFKPDRVPSDRMMPPRDGMFSRDSLRSGPRGHGSGMPPGPGLAIHDESFYVPCTLSFNDSVWTNVGFRLKGNSSLMHCWNDGIKKFPFRLKFGAFHDSLPGNRHQCLYGFRELSFSNGMNDQSFMREKMAADLFRQVGVPSAQTAFYQVYVNNGEEQIYWGLYTAVEVIDDTMLKHAFGDDSGNCYKPDGRGASFEKGSYDAKSFPNKTHRRSKDRSDIKALFAALHDSLRLTNSQQWRDNLNKVLDVNAFLRWLAVNSVIQNRDTYGRMAHNYYLYHNPASDQLVWIPWDNNEALSGGRMHDGSLSHTDVSERWPLIRYLLDQDELMAVYRDEMKRFVEEAYDTNAINKQIDAYEKLLLPYVMSELPGYTFSNSKDEFQQSVKVLKQHINQRSNDALAYLKQSK